MKIQMIFLSSLIVLAGVLPFLSGFDIVPEVLTTTPFYYFIVIAVGFLSLIYGVLNKMIFGTEKLVMISVGLITLLGGVLPFLKGVIALNIPTTGVLYSGVIILIGVLGFIYGASTIG